MKVFFLYKFHRKKVKKTSSRHIIVDRQENQGGF